MIKSYSDSGQVSLKTMWFNIATSLIDAGFVLDNAYPDQGNGSPDFGSPTTTPNDQCLVYIFSPTATVDPHFDTNPWNIVVRLTESHYTLNVVTPSQLIFTESPADFRVAKTGENTEAGRLTRDNVIDQHFFKRAASGATWNTCYANNPDYAQQPISYILTVTDHGLVFYSWAESFDRAGDCHNWFVIQRGVNKDGTADSSTHLPIYCMFSTNGGGGGAGANVDAIDVNGILQFVVREDDVNMPTKPTSAVIPTPDTPMLVNPIQQTGTTEDGKFVMSMPEGMCTMRNKYDTQMDLIAYTSADVIAQSEVVPQTMYGEETPRNYRAMNANYSNNKGMRIFILIQ